MSLHAAAMLLALAVADGRAVAATDAETKEGFEKAVAALEKGDAGTAIVEFEALADRGVVHPDISFDRGLAYARRAAGPDGEAGDLGRAAAAFEEARRMRPTDSEADRAVDQVRAEVARRRLKQDKNDVLVRPTLGRALMTFVAPGVWSIAAMVSSLLFAIGVLMRARPSGWIHLAGTILAPFTLLTTLALAPIAYYARDHAATRKPGVIIVPEAALETDEGKPADAPVIPEASLVEVGDRKDDRVLVRWGNYEGWVPWRSVRALAQP